ncbi:hypothetical protein Q3G72_015425 [Acer saccharum]|nr:hypothetical protein Q3G72_015425 [Acer saccharum]
MVDPSFIPLEFSTNTKEKTKLGSGVASQQEFSKHNSLPFQETPERSNQVSSGQGGTFQKKPFFSLLMPEEQIGEAETALTLNNERGRTRGEAIDLNLKL